MFFNSMACLMKKTLWKAAWNLAKAWLISSTKLALPTSTATPATRFQYCGDITPAGDLPPLSRYFVDKDSVNLIKYIYPTSLLQEIAHDDEMVATFFSNCHIDEGCALILLEAEQDEIDDQADIATNGEEQDYK
jgi:hypothetical protein